MNVKRWGSSTAIASIGRSRRLDACGVACAGVERLLARQVERDDQVSPGRHAEAQNPLSEEPRSALGQRGIGLLLDKAAHEGTHCLICERHALRFLLVNDGSTDGTWQVLQALHTSAPQGFLIYHLSKNAGKAEAVCLGMLRALASDADYVA